MGATQAFIACCWIVFLAADAPNPCAACAQTAAAATTDAEAQPVTHPVAPRRVLPKVAAAARFAWAVIAGIAADVAGTSPAAIAAKRSANEGRGD